MLLRPSTFTSPFGSAGDRCRASAHGRRPRQEPPRRCHPHRRRPALHPRITFVAPAEPEDETVWFSDAYGTGFELALTTEEPDPDAERVAYPWNAVAAAIGNHPHFIRAALEQKSFGPLNLDTVTALTRTGNKYTLPLTADR
jgi:hypothetical protein